MIDSEAQLKITLNKIKDLQASFEQDLSEIPADVREKVIRERRELIAALERDVMNYQASKIGEEKIV